MSKERWTVSVRIKQLDSVRNGVLGAFTGNVCLSNANFRIFVSYFRVVVLF